ncbi:nuclear transport factor 2 family protein [Myxococcota bacterium]|nr:nuclear transport factor 2 family protein [Myxococcota bacterium]
MDPRSGGVKTEEEDDVGTEENRDRVLAYLESIRVGDRALAYAAFAEDATWTTPPSLPWPGFFQGRKAIFDEYFAVDKGLFTTGVESYDLENTNVVAAGESVVVEMRHRAVGLDGQRYETDHCLVFEVRDGLIHAVREYIDSHYLHQQLLV